MSYMLKTDEMLDVLIAGGHAIAAVFKQQLEELTQEMANALAEEHGIMAGKATAEGVAFAGTGACFYAIYAGQELPPALAVHEFDDKNEFGTYD